MDEREELKIRLKRWRIALYVVIFLAVFSAVMLEHIIQGWFKISPEITSMLIAVFSILTVLSLPFGTAIICFLNQDAKRLEQLEDEDAKRRKRNETQSE